MVAVGDVDLDVALVLLVDVNVVLEELGVGTCGLVDVDRFKSHKQTLAVAPTAISSLTTSNSVSTSSTISSAEVY